MAAPRKKSAPLADKDLGRDLTRELADLLHRLLLPDLRSRASDPGVLASLRRRHETERAAGRSADRFDDWQAHLLEQVGAAWILSCVFVRTLEDRGLLAQRRLRGPGARDAEQLFFEQFPALSPCDYLRAAFREVSRLPGGAVLGPAQNLAFRLAPSAQAAAELLAFFRKEEADGGFSFASGDTRFLGDLYQDLSASVRERYALLQTPAFVERFILDLTLTPAIETFGLEKVRLIDPTCGSGHFLLGAFARLCEERMRRAPGLDRKEAARLALAKIHGADINPYAVAIARFRLTLAYLEQAGLTRLAQAPSLPMNLVVADSLLHGARGQSGRLSQAASGAARRAWGDHLFELEDEDAARAVLGQRYHAVVGNPPYITCKDAARRELYRDRYQSAAGKYALAAPFTELFFELAADDGFVGLINANSFMKREFGKKLIEVVLPRYDLTQVIDTAGAFIPGHGTPTVLLFGRHRKPLRDTIRAVLGKRGEPGVPQVAEQGAVWQSIAAHHGEPGYEDEYISVVDKEREAFAKHPWSLGGGGVSDLKELIEERTDKTLRALCTVGVFGMTNADECMLANPSAWSRTTVPAEFIRPVGIGEEIRDWSWSPEQCALYPYHWPATLAAIEEFSGLYRFLWPYKTTLGNRATFGGGTYFRDGLPWWKWHQVTADRVDGIVISYGEISTHNHFVLDRGGKVFNRTAPIIKLPADATEEDHLALLGYLNSSTACFWMKQVCFDKGQRGQGGGLTAEEWERFYAFSATKISQLPVPTFSPAQREELVRRSRSLLDLAAARQAETDLTPLFANATAAGLLREAVQARQQRIEDLEHQIRAQQESLDWWIYSLFDLAPVHLADGPDRLAPGGRACDVRFAHEVLAGGSGRRYFELCRLPPPEEVAAPAWATRFQLASRLAAMEASPWLQILETPVYKRTFREGFRPLDVLSQAREWLRARCEEDMRLESRPSSVRELSHRLAGDPHVAAVLDAYFSGGAIEDVLAELVREDAVPYLAALRYTDAGLAKRQQWEATWDLQRREDRGEPVSEIPVPPKYDATDFRDQSYFRLRGKLDVPRERFILYPGAERDTDPSPLIGWAGWDHAQRAMALAELFMDRKTTEGWDAERLRPLLAGVQELVPWVKQWHNQPNPDFDGERLGDYFARFVDTEARSLGLAPSDLPLWRPAPRGRARSSTPRARRSGL